MATENNPCKLVMSESCSNNNKLKLKNSTKRLLSEEEESSSSGRERLKRHRVDMAGRVWIPDLWPQEPAAFLIKDCTSTVFADAAAAAARRIMKAARASSIMEQQPN